MTTAARLIAIAQALEQPCDICGIGVVIMSLDGDRLVLIDAKVYENEDGHFYVRCDQC